MDVEWPSSTNRQASPLNPHPVDSLETLVVTAIRHHPEIRALVARVVESRADFVQAGLWPNPVLQGALGLPIDGGGGSPGMAAAMVAIADLWKRPARKRSAEADLRVSLLTLSDASLTFVRDVKVGVSEQVHARRSVLESDRAARVWSELVELWEASERSGEASRQAVNTAVLAAGRARDRLEVDLDACRQAEVRLAERVGSKVLLSDRILPELAGLRSSDPAPWAGLLYRFDVQAALASIDSASARERLAQWSRLPEVSVGARFERNFSNRKGVFPQAQVELPIFDTGRAAAAKAEAIASRTEAECESVLWSALLEIRLASSAYEVAQERWKIWSEVSLPAASESWDLAQSVYEAGELSGIDLRVRETEYLRVRREGVDRSAACYSAWFELERALGGYLPEPDSQGSPGARSPGTRSLGARLDRPEGLKR